MITLSNINKRYLSQSALTDVNMTFPAHGFVSIVGPSGCGKSTLLNIIGGIDHDYQGKIMLDGKEVKSLPGVLRVTMIFQSYHLIHYLSNLHNIHLYDDFHQTKFPDYNNKMMEGFQKVPVTKLSLGQRQRVAILRALYPEPDIILCDEPTASLDAQNKALVMNALKEISHNALVIFVSHDRHLVDEYSDYIYHMEDGEITNTMTCHQQPHQHHPIKRHFHPFAIFRLSVLALKCYKKRFFQMCFYLSLALVSIMLVFTLSFSLRYTILDYIDSMLPKSTISFKSAKATKITKQDNIPRVFYYVDDIELLGLSENGEHYLKNETLFINDETGYTNKVNYGHLISSDDEIILPYNTARKLAGNDSVHQLIGKHFYIYYKYRNLVKGVEVKIAGISMERLSYDAFYQNDQANIKHLKSLFSDNIKCTLGILYYKGNHKKVMKELEKQYPSIQFKIVGEKTKQNMNKTIDKIEFILFLFALIAILSSCFMIGEIMYLFVESHVKDYAIECAYGARRFQLFKQLFYSIIIVVVVGGVVSVNLLYGFVTILNKIVLPKLFASSFYISIPFMLVSVTLAGAFILVIISALASFLRISHLNVADVLKR